jgi:hypothetical protein
MATTYRVLGQSAPVSDTETTVYTVPASTQTIISSIIVSNSFQAQESTVSIAVRPSADAVTTEKHYVMRRNAIPPNGTSIVTAGITMSAGDKVLIFVNGSACVSVFGSEIA